MEDETKTLTKLTGGSATHKQTKKVCRLIFKFISSSYIMQGNGPQSAGRREGLANQRVGVRAWPIRV